MNRSILAGAVSLIAVGGATARQVFEDKDPFLEAVGSYYFNPFDDVSFGPSPQLDYTYRGLEYTIAAPSGLFCNAGEVSTEVGVEPLVLDVSGDPRWLEGFGGSYWVRDASFEVIAGEITIAYSDGTEDVFPSKEKGTFRGYVSGEPLTQMRISAVADGGLEGWVGMDDLYIQVHSDDCFMDCNWDGSADLFDFLCFIAEFNAGRDYGDCTHDGVFDLFDFLCYVNVFNGDC